MIVRRRLAAPRNVVVLLPSGATLLNLFFGIFAIVQASRGEYGTAALFVVLGGVADMLDGRIARATGTGTRFGEELDSLVDAITFGLAPALIMYFAVLNQYGWDWIWVFVYAAAAVTRLARFNVEQAGTAKTHFHGLPSPAAGMTLATYIWFGQTSLYNNTILFFGDNKVLADLPWHTLMRFLMVGLATLMVSSVPYPTVPPVGIRSLRQIIGTIVVLGSLLCVIFLPREFFFPALLAYILFGIIQGFVLRVIDRPATPVIFLEEEPNEDEGEIEVKTVPDVADVDRVPRSERHRRPHRGEGGERPERPERPDRGERPDRSDRPERERRPDRDRERPRADRPAAEPRPSAAEGEGEESAESVARKKKRRRRGRERGDRAERADRPPRAERSEGSERESPTEPPASPSVPPTPPAPPRQEPDE